MFKEERKIIDCWTFSWHNPRTGQQLIRMKLYECSGLFVSQKYTIEMENKYGFVFDSFGGATSDSFLMGYFFDIYVATVIDTYIRKAERYYNFDEINDKDIKIIKSFHWNVHDESYPNNPKLKYPHGNGWFFNPHTKDYFAFFRGNSILDWESWGAIKTLNVPEWRNPESYSVNLKISNKTAFLETMNGVKIYEFTNSDHALFLAYQSIEYYDFCATSLLDKYYKG